MSKEKTLRTLEETEVMQATGIPTQEADGAGAVMATEIIADLKKERDDLQENLDISMTNGVIVLLKTVLNAAVDDEILMKNPAASVKPLRKDDRPKASETIHRALTREEQQAFMQEANGYMSFSVFPCVRE
mgnify:CR=1 FL=1